MTIASRPKPFKGYNVRLDLDLAARFEKVLRAETKQGIAALLIREFVEAREAQNAGVAQ